MANTPSVRAALVTGESTSSPKAIVTEEFWESDRVLAAHAFAGAGPEARCELHPWWSDAELHPGSTMDAAGSRSHILHGVCRRRQIR